jgi:ATP-binding protein involved in chromosome partitioning
MALITQELLLDALSKVMDPELGKDLVTLNMIKDLKFRQDGLVEVTIALTSQGCQMKAKIEGDVAAALRAVPGVTLVQVKLEAKAAVAGSKSQAKPIEGVKNVIAVSSGKGGVGKSTVAVNLACALAAGGHSVGLMDADIYGPNIPAMLGIEDGPEVLEDPDKGQILLPPSVFGVKVMSMAFLIERDQPVIWRGPMLHKIIQQFCENVAWGELEYLIVDMPPGTGDVQLSLNQLVPISGAVLVTTPQEVSILDVGKAYKMFEKTGVRVLGLVENMSYFICDGCQKRHHIFGSGGGRALAERFCVELLAEIPIVSRIGEGKDSSTPVVVGSPDSVVGRAFFDLSRKIAQKS